MSRSPFSRRATLGLAAGLALTFPPFVLAQTGRGTTGAGLPMSSGSGTGTATGSTTGTGGVSSTGSGSTITGGPAGTRMGSQGFGTGGVAPGGGSLGGSPNLGVGRSPFSGLGGGAHFPDDPTLVPIEVLEGGRLKDPSAVTTIDPTLLRDARRITDDGERALTLQRLANAAIFSNELAEAHHALTEAAQAALGVETPLVRDQRMIAIITSLLALAEADLREGKGESVIPEVAEALPPPTSKVDRDTLIKRARHEWERAAFLAFRITNPTYRNELMYRVVDGESYGSQTIAREFPSAGSRAGIKEAAESYDTIADRILDRSADEAVRIERPVWRDRALVEISVNAAGGRRFVRALRIARLIPQPEVRTDALVRIAEIQARGDHPDEATATYEEAARAVASIPLDDPRAVLAGVLIDNLISVGRFDDARASVVLYPDTPRRLIALGAVAESQGRRGAAEEARKWIGRDVPEQYRSVLYRRVADGIIEAVEQNRSRQLTKEQ
jgi:hypothetical protein